MSDIRSSQRRRSPIPRDSSVTQVRIEIPTGASTASVPDDEATVISSRMPGATPDAPPLLAPLEVGKLLEGEQLGQFELRQFVGGGGMGVVFRAWDTTLNREVAVKVLSRDQSADDETLRRFRNEAQSAARLDHANIARVYYVGEDRGVHYIVFEFIEGVNLRDLVDRRGQLPVDEAIDYTLQLAEALDHASQRDVIHRDIKPSNVLITAEGHAKLVDMGLARLHQVEHTNDDLTASGVTLGTFDYISPEQARDPRSADVRSDLYSLGCSLYFMLVGQPPFPHGTVLQKLLQHQGEEPPDLRILRPDLPIEMIRVVRKLLAKSPQQRHQRPVDLIADLHSTRDRLASGASSKVKTAWALPTPHIPRRWNKHLPWAVPLTALAITCLGLDYYWTQADRAAMGLTQATINNVEKPVTPRKVEPAAAKPAAVEPKAPAPVELPTKTKPTEAALPSPSSETPAPEVAPPAADTITPDSATNEPKDAEVTPTKESPKEPASTEPAKTPEVVVPTTAVADGVLTVGDSKSKSAYPTLAAACAAAKNGDVIELRFNGARDEAPISIADRKLTIRAGDGYRPVVRFKADSKSDVAATPMISLTSGSLAIVDLAIEFDAPGTSADAGLFDLRGTEFVRLEHSIITIRGNAKPSAKPPMTGAVFSIGHRQAEVPREAQAPRDATAETRNLPTMVELRNSIVRGQASLVDADADHSARLLIENSLLALSDRLLTIGSGKATDRVGRIEVDARHLTADLQGGLADLGAAANPLVDLRFADSILCSRALVPLIVQTGTKHTSDGEGALSWSGERNFYEGVDTFWKIISPDKAAASQALAYPEWQAYWGTSREMLGFLNAVVWKNPRELEQPADALTPADFALSTATANNPARDSASDGLDAGCLLNLLPSLP